MPPVRLEPIIPPSQAKHSTTEPLHSFGEESAGCFTFNVFLMTCGCYYLPLPQGAVDWSTVCDCGISWSYSLALFLLPLVIKRSEADRVLMLLLYQTLS